MENSFKENMIIMVLALIMMQIIAGILYLLMSIRRKFDILKTQEENKYIEIEYVYNRKSK